MTCVFHNSTILYVSSALLHHIFQAGNLAFKSHDFPAVVKGKVDRGDVRCDLIQLLIVAKELRLAVNVFADSDSFQCEGPNPLESVAKQARQFSHVI